MEATDEGVRPFDSGTQYLDWTNANCCTCAKMADEQASLDEMPCDIERALVEAQFDAGRIPLEIADRMGRDEGRYIWNCLEHQEGGE
jgi:hypothetical protein